MNGSYGSPPAPFGPSGSTSSPPLAPYGQASAAAYGPAAPHGGQTPSYGPPAGGYGQAPSPYGAPAGSQPPSYGAAPSYGPAAPHGGQTPSYGPPAGGYGQAPSPYGAYGPSPSYAPPGQFGYQQPGTGYAPAAITNGAPMLRWIVSGTFAGTIVVTLLGGVIGAVAEGDEIGSAIAGVFSVLSIPLILTYVVTALVWLYKSWEMLPDSMRVTGNGTRVSPGQAVGYLFIPFYNLYWYFVCSAGLTTALNRALANYGSPKRASGGLAIAAAILQVIPYVNLFFAPFLWIAFMFNVESAKREYARLSGRA
ncbi:MAG: DUF4328 domain-containing protein [Labilithrix sp.]|nr:DUF4328 domain-containing protein [Labilithrix sp.]